MSHLRRSSTRSAASIGRPFRLLSILGAAMLVGRAPGLRRDLHDAHQAQSAGRPRGPGRQSRAGPANYYAQFWHENAINGKQYGFSYDDDASQSSDISVANPQYMIVAVGW
jgi:hypothetical protein